AIELVDDLEDALLALPGRRVRKEQPPDAKMLPGTRLLRDQRIGRFLDPVVPEPVRAVGTLDQLLAHRLPEIAVDLLVGGALHQREGRRRSGVAPTSD